MKKLLVACFFSVLGLPSCQIKNLLFAPQAPKSAAAVKANNAIVSAEKYIDRFQNIAIAEMNKNGIPASITLAQGLLESGNGMSELAQKANNHFGIKCNSDWKGDFVLRDDDEQDECFRVYSNPEESYRDHSEFLKRKRYASLFELNKNDYRGWARGLKEAGYATNPKYADLLISIIERYQLYRFDSRENLAERTKREERILTEITKEEPKEKETESMKVPVSMKIYEVKTGDTLFSIAQKAGLSVEDLKLLNNMQSDTIRIGQLLLISK